LADGRRSFLTANSGHFCSGHFGLSMSGRSGGSQMDQRSPHRDPPPSTLIVTPALSAVAFCRRGELPAAVVDHKIDLPVAGENRGHQSRCLWPLPDVARDGKNFRVQIPGEAPRGRDEAVLIAGRYHHLGATKRELSGDGLADARRP
jgi:hypothetical protein